MIFTQNELNELLVTDSKVQSNWLNVKEGDYILYNALDENQTNIVLAYVTNAKPNAKPNANKNMGCVVNEYVYLNGSLEGCLTGYYITDYYENILKIYDKDTIPDELLEYLV